MTTRMPSTGDPSALPGDHNTSTDHATATGVRKPGSSSAQRHMDFPSSTQISTTLAAMGINSADPRSPAVWARPETTRLAFTEDFIRDQQITYRTQVSSIPVKIEAQAKNKPKPTDLPTVTDMWLVASGYATAGDRLRVARCMLGWSQVVTALEAGQSGPARLNQFELGKIANLASLELVCRAIHIDLDWVQDGHDTNMPDWLTPWRRASIEAFALCDQLTRDIPDAYHDLVREQRRAPLFLAWFNDPKPHMPQRQFWWDEHGSLLPWFAEASSHYNLTSTAVDILELTERAVRDLQAIVTDWCVLRAKIEQVPGLAERIRSPGRQLSLADGKRLEAEFRRVCRWTRSSTWTGLPSTDTAMDAVAQTMIPHRHHLRTVQPIAADQQPGKRIAVAIAIARSDPPAKPTSPRGRKKSMQKSTASR